MKSQLQYLLGIHQIRALSQAYQQALQNPIQFQVSSFSVLIAFVIALLPALAPLVSREAKLDITTVLIGLSAALAIAFRVHKKIPFYRRSQWRQDLSHVHTAVALGCIPVVLILILHSHSLYQIGDSLGPIEGGSSESGPTALSLFFVILQISVWVSVTEEFIFRGLLISVVRRWSALRSQLHRDILAISLSSILFGLAHLHQWGPLMCLGLTGLGIGFGFGYLAIREQLLPLILYHAIFDALSLSIAIFA